MLSGKRRQLFLVFARAIGLALVGCAATPSVVPDNELFERYEIVTGEAGRQTVLTGFVLDGPTAELIVLQVARNKERQLSIYSLGDDAWTEVVMASLSPAVKFVDTATIAGRERLITYAPGRLSWFDPASATEKPLVDIKTTFRPENKWQIPRLDITRDVNGDGLDDLVVPDVDGFWVSRQLRNGTFTDMRKLGPAEPYLDDVALSSAGMDKSRSYRDVGISEFTFPLYQRRLYVADMNLDGRDDLVFWNKGHFDVYHQTMSGSFNATPDILGVDVPIDADGIYSRAFGFRDDGVLSFLFGFNEYTQLTVLYALRDLNDDQLPDLVTLTLSGRSLARQRSKYQVYFGAPTTGGIEFTRKSSTSIEPRGSASAMQPWGYGSQLLRDIDGDGDADFAFRDIKIGFGGMARALAGRSVALDLEFYPMENREYAEESSILRAIRPSLDLSGNGVFLPAVMLGDVDGDSCADLLVGKSRDALDLYLGMPGAELFTRNPLTLSVRMPNDERNAWLADLNKDNKKDILVYLPSDDRPHRVITLIARQVTRFPGAPGSDR